MSRRILFFALALGLLASPALASDPATPETPTPAAQARALFEAGKILEARDAYAAAAKADPGNPALERQREILSRVLDLDATIREEEVSPTWERMVLTLHGYYLSQGLAQNALELDRAAYERQDSAVTAGLVLESMLETNENEGALKFAQGLREGQMTDGNRVFKNIAAARLGQKDLVKEDLDLYGVPGATDAGTYFDLARLQALMGEKERALASLKTAFEVAPPRGIPTLRTLAAESPDLEGLAGETFQKVLETTPAARGDETSGGCGDCDEKGAGETATEPKAKSGGGCGGCDEKGAGETATGTKPAPKKKSGGCCGG